MAGDISEYRCFAPLAFWKWMSSCRDGMMASHNISVSFSKGLTNASQNSMTSKNLLKAKLFRPESTFFMDKKKKGVFGSRSTSVSFDHWNVHFLRYFYNRKHKDTKEKEINDIEHRTVFENHRKSLIQHCERSELRLHFEWTKVN